MTSNSAAGRATASSSAAWATIGSVRGRPRRSAAARCAPRNVERRWLPRGWRLVEYAIRTCNRSLTKKRALSLQVRDPHNCDHVPIIERLLLCVLVAGPDKVLLGRKGLSLLLEPKLALGDMADHGIHHRGTHSLRSRLHNDIAH